MHNAIYYSLLNGVHNYMLYTYANREYRILAYQRSIYILKTWSRRPWEGLGGTDVERTALEGAGRH